MSLSSSSRLAAKIIQTVFSLAFICLSQTALGQDTTKPLKQEEWLRQSSYDSLGLSQIQIAQLDSIDNSYSNQETVLIKNHTPGESGLGKKLDRVTELWEKARRKIMTKQQYKEYRSRFKPIPMVPLPSWN